MYFYCEVLANLGLGETVDLAAGALQKTGGVMSGGVRLGGNLDMPLEKRLTGIFSDDTYREMLWLASDNSIQVGDVKSEIAIRTKGSLNILINDKWHQGYHTGFKPTAADIGAITKQETDNNYVRQGSSAVVYKDDDLTWNSPTGAYLKQNEGYTSLIWHMGLNVGSASAAQFYFDYANGGLKYRSSRDNHGFEKPWARIYSDQDKPTADEIGAIAFHGGLSQDLNSVFTPGVYCNVYDAYATSEHHYPIAFAGSLFIYLNSANGRNGVTQEYRPYNSNKLFRRFYYVSSASWSVWAEEYNTQNRPTAEDVGALPVGGVATAASKLAIARKINGVLFDGTEDINIASGWSKVASGSVNYPLVNSQTKSFVGTIDTGVATTSWIHDLKKYAVVLSSKGNQVVTSNPNNCSWGASAELRSMTRFYGNSTILIDVFTYGQNLQSGSVSTWELWEIVS